MIGKNQDERFNLNMDQTPVFFEMLPQTALNQAGARTGSMQTTTRSTKRVTIGCCCSYSLGPHVASTAGVQRETWWPDWKWVSKIFSIRSVYCTRECMEAWKYNEEMNWCGPKPIYQDSTCRDSPFTLAWFMLMPYNAISCHVHRRPWHTSWAHSRRMHRSLLACWCWNWWNIEEQ